MSHVLESRRVALFVEQYFWPKTQEVTHALQKISDANPTPLHLIVRGDPRKPRQRTRAMKSVLRALANSTEKLLLASPDAEYAATVKPLYIEECQFLVLAVRHVSGHEWLITSQTDDKELPPDVEAEFVGTINAICTERRKSDRPPQEKTDEAFALAQLIHAGIEFVCCDLQTIH